MPPSDVPQPADAHPIISTLNDGKCTPEQFSSLLLIHPPLNDRECKLVVTTLLNEKVPQSVALMEAYFDRKWGRDPNRVIPSDNDAMPPLAYAKSEAMVEILIKAGANPWKANGVAYGRTLALQSMLRNRANESAVTALLKAMKQELIQHTDERTWPQYVDALITPSPLFSLINDPKHSNYAHLALQILDDPDWNKIEWYLQIKSDRNPNLHSIIKTLFAAPHLDAKGRQRLFQYTIDHMARSGQLGSIPDGLKAIKAANIVDEEERFLFQSRWVDAFDLLPYQFPSTLHDHLIAKEQWRMCEHVYPRYKKNGNAGAFFHEYVPTLHAFEDNDGLAIRVIRQYGKAMRESRATLQDVYEAHLLLIKRATSDFVNSEQPFSDRFWMSIFQHVPEIKDTMLNLPGASSSALMGDFPHRLIDGADKAGVEFLKTFNLDDALEHLLMPTWRIGETGEASNRSTISVLKFLLNAGADRQPYPENQEKATNPNNLTPSLRFFIRLQQSSKIFSMNSTLKEITQILLDLPDAIPRLMQAATHHRDLKALLHSPSPLIAGMIEEYQLKRSADHHRSVLSREEVNQHEEASRRTPQRPRQKNARLT